MSLLSEAVDIIVSGKSCSDGFVDSFRAAVADTDKKWQAIEALLANHQMHRVSRVYGLIKKIEDMFYEENGVYELALRTSPEFGLEAMKVLLKEGNAITEYVNSKKFPPPSDSVVDPNHGKKMSEVESRVKKLNPEKRAALVGIVEKVRSRIQAAKETNVRDL
jgi:hypothetical protein